MFERESRKSQSEFIQGIGTREGIFLLEGYNRVVVGDK